MTDLSNPSALALHLARTPRSVAAARRSLEQWCRARGVRDDRCDNAVLAVSELVTNAVEHGEGPIELWADVRGDSLVVEISDGAQALTVDEPLERLPTSGRGLVIVAALSQRWGVSPRPGGKTVWARFAAGDIGQDADGTAVGSRVTSPG